MMSAFPTKLAIDPDVPCEAERFVEPKALILPERGVHAGLQWKEPQQMSGEPVHRSDLRLFQIEQRRLGACRDFVGREAVSRAQLIRGNGPALGRLSRRRTGQRDQPL